MIPAYIKRELRTVFRVPHYFILLGVLAVFMADSTILPGMPDTIFRFFKKVFLLQNWTEVILINDFMGLFYGLFWMGVMDLLRVYVLPQEEGYLSLLLAKPLSRSQYLFGKVLPIFVVVMLMGLLLSLFLPLKIALLNGSADLHMGSVIAAGIVATLLALALLALLNLVFLFAQETYYAVLWAFLLFTLVVLPAGVFVYRPDVYQTQPLLRTLLVFPGNLLWLSDDFPKLLPALLLIVSISSILLLAGSSWRLKRMDIQ